MKNVDCIVVGGGMVGLSAAKALIDLNLSVAIIEPHQPKLRWSKASHALRVSAINRESQVLFTKLDVWESFQQHATAYTNMHIWDENSAGEITFDCTGSGLTELGHIIENRVITKGLWQALKKTNAIFCPEKLVRFEKSHDEWSVTLSSGKTLGTKCIIGADGPGSTVRTMAGIQTHCTHFNQHGIVAVVKTEKPHQKTAWQRFLSKGPLAFLPLEDDHLCSIVWTVAPEQAKTLSQGTEEAFNSALSNALEHQLGECQVLSERACFPLSHHHCEKYSTEGLILIGDAAHSIHPLAGLGANLGFHDVLKLQEHVQSCLDKKRPFYSNHSLQKIEQQVRFKNELTRQAMNSLNALFSNEKPLLKGFRGLGLNLINQQSLLKTFLMRMAGD